MKAERWFLAPAAVFLFVLPYNHTVALRLLALLAAACCAIWIRAATRDMPDAPRLPGDLPAWRWLAFWALLPLVFLPFSHAWRISLDEAKTEIAYGLVTLLTFFVAARAERLLRVAAATVLASSAVYVLWGIAAHPLWHHGNWAARNEWINQGYLGGPGTSAAYFITILPLVWLTWRLRLFGEGRASRVLPAALLVLIVVAGALTGNRIFFVALAVQGIVLLLLARPAGARRLGPGALVFAGLAILLGLLVVAYLAARVRFGAQADLFAELRGDPRLQNWGMVLRWIAERPWTGYGFGRGMMKEAFPQAVAEGGLFWHPHNTVLAYGFELGLAGFVAILGLFGALLSHWWRLARVEDRWISALGIAGVLLVTGVFVRNMTDDFFRRDLALLFWALTGLLAGLARARARP